MFAGCTLAGQLDRAGKAAQPAPAPAADPTPPPVAEAPPPPVVEAPPPAVVTTAVYVEAAPVEASAYPTTPQPDPIPEYRPPLPGYGYYWVTGWWEWNGYDWDWQSGYWMPPRAGWAYYGPRYVWESGNLVYYRGYWMGPGGEREYGYGPRGAPPAQWRARPNYEPRAWRAEPAHSMACASGAGARLPPAGTALARSAASPRGTSKEKRAKVQEPSRCVRSRRRPPRVHGRTSRAPP